MKSQTRRAKNSREASELNRKAARARWGRLPEPILTRLVELTNKHQLSVAMGDLLYLNNGWYVTHSGLLGLAARHRCLGIRVQPLEKFCDPSHNRWAFKATVYKTRSCKGFAGYGDADPSNVSQQVRGAEMRVAETRAVNRALRKAYGIGICSVEELGSSSAFSMARQRQSVAEAVEPAHGNGHHPLRDRLCLLIRQHHLDPTLVKAYAADYCDVPELRQASRDQVATFIKHLAEYAQSDREALLAQLNSYAPKPVATASAPNEDSSASVQEETRGAA